MREGGEIGNRQNVLIGILRSATVCLAEKRRCFSSPPPSSHHALGDALDPSGKMVDVVYFRGGCFRTSFESAREKDV
jgi:hypothetical protein